MHHYRAAFAASCLPLLAAAVVAQQPGDGFFASVRTPIHRAPDDSSSAPGLWAAGAGYKASFDGGVRFVPYLGAAAAENAVLRWRTIGFGDVDVPATAGREPSRVSDCRCEYDLGPVTEAYDVRVSGLEQTFVIAHEPVGSADVDVRGAIGGNLHGITRPFEHAPIDFTDALGNTVVRYGAATAIDAAGESTPLTTSLAGDVVTIRLPRQLLRRAAYPLVVDPLLVPVTLASGSSPTSLTGAYGHLAIERNDYATTRNIMVAYTRVASLIDTDVTALLCDDDFGNAVTVFADLDPNVASDDADVAFVGGADSWVLVLERTTGGYSGCRYNVRPGNLTSMSNALTAFSTPSSERETRPRVGGSRRPLGGGKALLVRQRDPASTPGNTGSTAVWASVLDVSSGAESTPVQVAGGSFIDAEAPAISKDSHGGSWVIAWQTWSGLLASQWQVKARRISQSGALAAGVLSSDRAGSGMHEIAPRVDGTSGRFLLAFGEVSAATWPGKISGDVFETGRVMRFDWSDGSTVPDATQPSATVTGNTGRDTVFGGVSHDTQTRSHWAIGTSNLAYGTSYLGIAGYQGERVYSEYLFTPSNPSESSNWHAVCFDDDNRRFLSLYARSGLAAGGTSHAHSVQGVLYEYPPAGAVFLGPGCGPAAIGTSNRFQRGNEFADVTMMGAPANMPALLVASWGTTNIPMDVFGMTGCVLQVDPGIGNHVTLGHVTDIFGSAGLTIPLPAAVAAQNIWFQWLHIAPGANAAQIQMTGGMRAEIR